MGENEDLECEISFSDSTMLEGEGIYSNIKKIMKKDVGDRDWMLRTFTTIITQSGESNFILHFWGNGDVYVIEYAPSIEGVYYNLDITALSSWSQVYGWHMPKISDDLIKKDIDLWKHFWETGLVGSDLLDKRYGVRDYLQGKEDNELEK